MNTYKLKKIASLIVLGIMPGLTAIITFIITRDFFLSAATLIVATAMLIFIHNRMTYHPLIGVLEGQGILTLTIDSTGIIRPFLVKKHQGGLISTDDGEITGEFDDENLFRLKTNHGTGYYHVNENGDIIIKIPREFKDGKGMFIFNTLPTFIYNSVAETFLARDALNKLEEEGTLLSLAKHIYRRHKEESRSMKDFARAVVDVAWRKPMMKNAILWIVIIAVILVLVIIGFKYLGGGAQNAVQALVPQSAGSVTVTP